MHRQEAALSSGDTTLKQTLLLHQHRLSRVGPPPQKKDPCSSFKCKDVLHFLLFMVVNLEFLGFLLFVGEKKTM